MKRFTLASFLLFVSLVAAAAYPVLSVAPPTESGSVTNVTSYTGLMGTGLTDGALCLFVGAGDGTGDYINSLSTYLDFNTNAVFYNPSAATYNAGGNWYFYAWSACDSADNSGSWTLGVTSAEHGVFFNVVVTGWDGVTPPNNSTPVNNASSNSCDAGSVTTWSGVDAIVFWFSARDPQNVTVTGFPTGFTDNQYEDTLLEPDDALTMASMNTTAGSVDASNATLSGTLSNACFTIAVRAPSAGGVVINPMRGLRSGGSAASPIN